MEIWAGIGTLGMTPALADTGVTPTGMSSALGACQELELLIQIPAEILVGSHQAESSCCSPVLSCQLVPWESSCSPLCFAGNFQGFYSKSYAHAESWFLLSFSTFSYSSGKTDHGLYLWELVDQTYIKQNKIQFSNAILFQCPAVKCCISNVLGRSPHK